MASFSYEYTDSWNHEMKVTVSYTATYDAETNCTTVVINSVKHYYWRDELGPSSWYCSVIVTALDSSYSAKTIGCLSQGAPSSSTMMDSTAKIAANTLIVQHSEEAGDKKVEIKCYTRLNYIYGDDIVYSNTQKSGSTTVTVAEAQPAFKHKNEMFIDRSHVLAQPDYKKDNSDIMGITIPYTTSYDPNKNQTTIKFSTATLYHTQGGVELGGNIKITITPVDNTEDVANVTLTVTDQDPGTGQGIATISLATSKYSSSEITVQHLSKEEGCREVTVKMTPNVKHTQTTSGSSYWTFDSDYTNTFISGIYKIPGLVYIDNGTEWVAYQFYVDNGESWDLYVPYVDDGTNWVLYS